MKKIIFCLFVYGVFVAQIANAQNTIMGRPVSPVNFNAPIDLFENKGRLAELYRGDSKKSIDKAWMVICDRDNNPTYERPNTSAKQVKTINFRDYFYVTQEQGEWIKIAKGRANGLQLGDGEDFGWVEKSKMLIWTNCLVNERTGIHEKTFLLNKAEDIEVIIRLEKKEVVPMYTGPQTENKADNLYIYKFFFVYKKENDRYLIGTEYVTNSYNVRKVIVGWVPAKRCAEWNTRICVEPNFDTRAFEERKNNQNLRLIAYKDRGGAKVQATSGVITQNQIYFDQDPCKGNVVTAANNPYRYPGSVVRYPLLSSTETSTDFFRTGVIGEITVKATDGQLDVMPTQDWAKVFEKYKIENKKFDNYDILFIIEGTDQMNEFKDAIIRGIEKAVDELREVKNVRIGALIYRDPINSVGGRFTKLQKMVPVSQSADLIDFIKKEPFSNFGEQDPYTGMYFGLNKALTEADLTEFHTNIVFIIGNSADFKADRIRRTAAEEQNDPALINSDVLIENLYKLDAHLYQLQCKNNDDRASQYFVKQGHQLMIENSKKQYNNYTDLRRHYPNLLMEEPYLADVESSSNIELTKSAIPGTLRKPIGANALNAAQIIEFIQISTKKSVAHLRQTNDNLTSIIEKGDNIASVAAGSFSPGILPFIKDLIQKSGISTEEAQNLGDYKYQLYAEVFVPKQVRRANYPTSSYVLFMPSQDLSEYIATLERFINGVGDGDSYTKRRNLFEAMLELVKRFSGNPNLPKEEGEKLSINQFIGLIQGVKDEGLVLVDSEQKFLLGDITSETSMSNEQLDKFINRIIEKTDNLKKAYRQGKQYEFAYSTGDEVYFWIPVEDSF
jgi:hypothetical protein